MKDMTQLEQMLTQQKIGAKEDQKKRGMIINAIIK